MKKLLFLLLIFISGCVSGEIVKDTKVVLDGPFNVTKIIDGDTIDINTSERIRFSGINAAEKGKCYYKEAKEKVKELIYGKDVFIEKDIDNKDKYGRLLRYIYLGNLNVNKYLVENGYVIVFDKYKDDTKRYDEFKEVEKIAIENKLGIWNCS